MLFVETEFENMVAWNSSSNNNNNAASNDAYDGGG